MGASWCSFSRSALASVALASAAAALAAEGVRSWNMSNLPAQLRVGDRVELSLLEPLAEGQALVLPEQLDIKSGVVLEALQDGRSGVVITVTHPGTVTIPSMRVTGTAPEEGATTEPVSLEVVSAISEKDETPQQPAPPVDGLAMPLSRFWKVLFSLLAMGLAMGVYALLRRWIAWRRRGKAPVAVAAVPELTPEEWAVRELNRISLEESWSTGNFKRHYFGVSEVLKGYIARRFDFDAEESLADEILRELERQERPAETLDQLESLFQTLDRVKFTDHRPDWAEPPRVVEETLGWIRRNSLGEKRT